MYKLFTLKILRYEWYRLAASRLKFRETQTATFETTLDPIRETRRFEVSVHLIMTRNASPLRFDLATECGKTFPPAID